MPNQPSSSEHSNNHSNKFNRIKRDIVIATITTIISGGIVSIPTFFYGKYVQRTTYIQKVNAAPQIYTEQLSELINMAINDGVQQSGVNGRAIVKARNDVRGSLESISELLNSEIDKLDQQLNNSATEEEIYETLQVLKKAWPVKKLQIEICSF